MHPRTIYAKKRHREMAKRITQIVLFNHLFKNQDTLSTEIQKELGLSRINFCIYLKNESLLEEFDYYGVTFRRTNYVTHFFLPIDKLKKILSTGGLDQEEGK